jgi:hypothetical protein
LTAKTLIIVRENADDFDQLRGMLMHEHDPQSALACELVERLAGIIWRLRRVPFFEAAIIDDRQAQLDDEARWNTSRTYKTPQEFDGGEGGAEEMSDAEWSVYVGHALIREGLCGDGLGGLTDLYEMIAALIRSALVDEALHAGLRFRVDDMKERSRGLS